MYQVFIPIFFIIYFLVSFHSKPSHLLYLVLSSLFCLHLMISSLYHMSVLLSGPTHPISLTHHLSMSSFLPILVYSSAVSVCPVRGWFADWPVQELGERKTSDNGFADHGIAVQVGQPPCHDLNTSEDLFYCDWDWDIVKRKMRDTKSNGTDELKQFLHATPHRCISSRLLLHELLRTSIGQELFSNQVGHQNWMKRFAKHWNFNT